MTVTRIVLGAAGLGALGSGASLAGVEELRKHDMLNVPDISGKALGTLGVWGTLMVASATAHAGLCREVLVRSGLLRGVVVGAWRRATLGRPVLRGDELPGIVARLERHDVQPQLEHRRAISGALTRVALDTVPSEGLGPALKAATRAFRSSERVAPGRMVDVLAEAAEEAVSRNISALQDRLLLSTLSGVIVGVTLIAATDHALAPELETDED